MTTLKELADQLDTTPEALGTFASDELGNDDVADEVGSDTLDDTVLTVPTIVALFNGWKARTAADEETAEGLHRADADAKPMYGQEGYDPEKHATPGPSQVD